MGLGYSLVPTIEAWGYGFDAHCPLHLGIDDYDLTDTIVDGNYGGGIWSCLVPETKFQTMSCQKES